jgi:hypothetical protein
MREEVINKLQQLCDLTGNTEASILLLEARLSNAREETDKLLKEI